MNDAKTGLWLANAVVAALLTASPAAAGQVAATIAVTPESGRAAVIIKTPQLPVPRNYKTSYRLLWQVYDPVAQRMEGNMLAGAFMFAAIPKLFTDGFLVADLKPGTYALTSYSQQDWWTLCYQDGSVQFTVKPGEVLYLGEFDAARASVELTRKAISTRRTSTKGTPVDFFDGVQPPAFAPVDDTGLAAAAAMVKSAMPLTTVVPKAAQLQPAKFGTGSTLFGGRRCGGYFQTKAK